MVDPSTTKSNHEQQTSTSSSSHTPGDHGPNNKYDPNFTNHVIQSMGPATNPRIKQVMSALIRHVHDFAREVDLTVDEWMAGVQMINRAGQMSTDRRNEGQLLCDVIGLESLVDEITYSLATAQGGDATSSAILGPFWREPPLRQFGDSMSFDTPADGELVKLHGRVTNASTGEPIAGATVDVWQASTNGLYEQQDPNQRDCNLRGKFETRSDGTYSFYCLRPTPYPVPGDGPAGKLLDLMDRHHYRPAHIHFIVLATGYKSITTQIFDAESKYLDDDSVFAVKDGLVVKFVPLEGDEQAKLELQYDIRMAPSL